MSLKPNQIPSSITLYEFKIQIATLGKIKPLRLCTFRYIGYENRPTNNKMSASQKIRVFFGHDYIWPFSSYMAVNVFTL